MIRFGMHSSLWTSAWTREGAELSVADAARCGLDIIEIALLEPDKVDVAPPRSAFRSRRRRRSIPKRRRPSFCGRWTSRMRWVRTRYAA